MRPAETYLFLGHEEDKQTFDGHGLSREILGKSVVYPVSNLKNYSDS